MRGPPSKGILTMKDPIIKKSYDEGIKMLHRVSKHQWCFGGKISYTHFETLNKTAAQSCGSCDFRSHVDEVTDSQGCWFRHWWQMPGMMVEYHPPLSWDDTGWLRRAELPGGSSRGNIIICLIGETWNLYKKGQLWLEQWQSSGICGGTKSES